MQVFTHLAPWRAYRATLEGRGIGFVPTMGALHEGHRSLLERARNENDFVVSSIFVNPTQFDDPADLARYPRVLEADLKLMTGLVDAVLSPPAGELYRAGHFDGVLTVVLKLFNLVAPARAYFGEKDWQQLELVTGMARALFLPVEVIACPTVRAPDGLALSSRNQRLSPAGRALAANFPRLLRAGPSAAAAAAALRQAGFGVDYVEESSGVRLGAVRLENIRLIDNVRL